MTTVHGGPLDFQDAKIDGPRRAPFEKGLFAGAGTIESAAIESHEPFDDLVGSFSADVPKGSLIELEARARVDGKWSGWFRLLEWAGGAGGRTFDEQKDALGFVDIDTLKLDRPANAFQYRLKMTGKPTLRRVAVAVSDSKAAPKAQPAFEPGPWVRDIRLIPRSQRDAPKSIRPRICSPTALSMVLERWGAKLSTVEVAELVRNHHPRAADPAYFGAGFGTWPLNIQAAATQGLEGQFARLNGLRDVQMEIAAGRPVAASVTIRPGDLSSAPKRSTSGHVMVVAGFTRTGEVIVYNPDSALSEVRTIYPRNEFERIWLERKRGAAYVLGPRFPAEMTAGAPCDLYHEPVEPSAEPMNKHRGSQLRIDERVRVLQARGNWARIEALDQPYWNGKAWQGYPGWVRTDALTLRPRETAPGANVSPSPDKILREAEGFLGKPYVWGGLKAEGVDCSGLVYLSYRAEGVETPRDARDQFRKAAKLRREQLRPGDLVFLTKPGAKPNVYHVMVYAGGDAMIESREGAGAIKTTFQERFGKPLAKIEAGELVPNLPGRKPAKVRIDFGSLLHP